MFSDVEIRTIVEFESHKHPVLSIYLNVDPSARSPEQYKQALRTLLSKADKAEDVDCKRVQNFVEMGFSRRGRGLIMFSCENSDFWWAQTLATPVNDAVFVGFRPYVRQLASSLNRYSNYGVIHVDQMGARLYRFNMGELEAAEGFLGEEIRGGRGGGWAAQRYQRHENEQARQNLQEAAELAEDFYRRSNTRHLILAGTEKNVATFKGLLSNRLRSMMLDRISVNANASPQEIQEKALELVTQASRQDAIETTDQLLARAQTNERAVLGLAETLTAVQNGRAEHVVILSNYARNAYRFVDSGTILLELTEESPLVSGRVRELPDAVDSVIRHSLLQEIDITMIDEHSGLQQAGKIGALTRY
jgi:peptide chain release factor subunit 1